MKLCTWFESQGIGQFLFKKIGTTINKLSRATAFEVILDFVARNWPFSRTTWAFLPSCEYKLTYLVFFLDLLSSAWAGSACLSDSTLTRSCCCCLFFDIFFFCCFGAALPGIHINIINAKVLCSSCLSRWSDLVEIYYGDRLPLQVGYKIVYTREKCIVLGSD